LAFCRLDEGWSNNTAWLDNNIYHIIPFPGAGPVWSTDNPHNPPLPTVTYTGSTKICQGDNLPLSVNQLPVHSYLWHMNGNSISGATGATYAANQTGLYTVEAKGPNGCASLSLPVSVTVTPNPIPIVSINGNVLSTGSYVSYQWFKDGAIIANAISASYTATLNGNYTVQVTDSNGCSGMSTPLTYTTAGITNTGAESPIRLFPNPSSDGIFYIDAHIPYHILVKDLFGRVLLTGKDLRVIDLGVHGTGMYLIELYDGNQKPIKVDKVIVCPKQ
jgi:hypothetical protein